MQVELYEAYLKYITKNYEYMWLELAIKAKWKLAAQGE